MHPNSYRSYLFLANLISIPVVIARPDEFVIQNSHLLNDRFINVPKETSLETIPVEANTEIPYNPYTKQHSGRHVCTLQKNVTIPIKTKEAYCKPVYKKYVEPCHDNQLCTGVRLIYETLYKDVITSKTTKQITLACCPGWLQAGNRSNGCNRPICNTMCQNGGICVKPNLCKCLKGFTGQYCETDLNECIEQKPCDQICYNTYGSFKCHCRENFVLESDGQTCRAEGTDNGPGLEAKDLEYELLDKRIHKLEIMFASKSSNRNMNSEVSKLSTNVDEISKQIKYFKHRLEEMEKYKSDIALLNRRLKQIEEKESEKAGAQVKHEKKTPYIWSNELHLT